MRVSEVSMEQRRILSNKKVQVCQVYPGNAWTREIIESLLMTTKWAECPVASYGLQKALLIGGDSTGTHLTSPSSALKTSTKPLNSHSGGHGVRFPFFEFPKSLLAIAGMDHYYNRPWSIPSGVLLHRVTCPVSNDHTLSQVRPTCHVPGATSELRICRIWRRRDAGPRPFSYPTPELRGQAPNHIQLSLEESADADSFLPASAPVEGVTTAFEPTAPSRGHVETALLKQDECIFITSAKEQGRGWRMWNDRRQLQHAAAVAERSPAILPRVTQCVAQNHLASPTSLKGTQQDPACHHPSTRTLLAIPLHEYRTRPRKAP
ncbi:hypothetical protein PR048_000415 [Dryococelus australis]|uniref:Uncharacterized protein n=1 Tax=Dryococelus australis TaxID=614101 RepID=A0ABQ9IFV9_9NEOP|nr:hypothetical protein PR048_000415 [Dryococelus australis]